MLETVKSAITGLGRKIAGSSKPSDNSAQSMTLLGARDRYRQWLLKLMHKGLFGVEHLLPVIETPCPADLPELMAYGATLTIDDETPLKAEIARLQPWGYGIQLRPGVSTAKHAEALPRMIYRSHAV